MNAKLFLLSSHISNYTWAQLLCSIVQINRSTTDITGPNVFQVRNPLIDTFNAHNVLNKEQYILFGRRNWWGGGGLKAILSEAWFIVCLLSLLTVLCQN